MNKRPLENDDACSFYLERKKRPCRMKKAEGMAFCPHHSHLGSEVDEKKGPRIPCPFDSSHFCYQSKLQKHLKICNAREKDNPEFFVQHINAGERAEIGEEKIILNDVDDDALLDFIKRIKILYKETNTSVSDAYALHPLLESEMKKLDDGLNSFKHMKQQGSLLSLLENRGLLSDGTCFVEFGAGKGQLMYWIVQCVPDKEKCSFVLIDRSAQRHKSDNKFKGTNLQIERIRIDIQHLHLGKVECVRPHLNKVVGISKHLCGSATDLALRCLTTTLKSEADEKETHHRALGFVMALCCHHRCTWSSYIGKDFVKDKNISESDFKLMCCIASWATCGQRKPDCGNIETKPAQEDSLEGGLLPDGVLLPGEVLQNRYIKLNLKHEEREEIGMMCKRLIDVGRLNYLKKLKYQVELVLYTDKTTSLENVALVAFYK